MKKKIISTALATLLCVTALAGCGEGSGTDKKTGAKLLQEGQYTVTTKGTPEKFATVYYDAIGGKDVMPIGGFYGPFGSGGSINGYQIPNFVSDKYYSLMQEAGVNMIVYSPDSDTLARASILEALRLGDKYNVGYFVYNTPLNQLAGRSTTYKTGDPLPFKMETLEKDVEEFSQYRSFLGFHVADEPFYYQMDGLEKAYTMFEEMGYTDYMMYSNALGYHCTDLVRGGWREQVDSETYYDALFNRIGLKTLSATAYPYTHKDTTDEEMQSLFVDLEALWVMAKEYDVPLWRMLQAGGQFNDAATEIPSVEPYQSEGELLFDVNLALAYGSKCIQYFTIVQPMHFSYAPEGTYDFERCGFFGAAGNITRWYYYAQKANKQVQAVDHVLMNSASMGIIAHGEKARAMARITKENEAKREDIIATEKFRQLTKVTGDDCYVGCFDYKGGTALYVVNHSRSEKARVGLDFDGNYGYDVIQRAKKTSIMGESFDLVLEAGEGVLITLR